MLFSLVPNASRLAAEQRFFQVVEGDAEWLTAVAVSFSARWGFNLPRIHLRYLDLKWRAAVTILDDLSSRVKAPECTS